MTNLPNGLRVLKLEISKLIQENKYDQILEKIDSFEKLYQLKNQTEELRKSEEKFKTIFQSSRDALMLLTTEGFFDCNQATIDIFGFSNKEEFLNLHPSDISPVYQPNGENSIDLANKYIGDALNKKIPMFEWVHKKKNDVFFYCEVLLSPISINNKKVVQALVRDISERKRAEEVLKRSEEKYRSLIENLKYEYFFYRHNIDGVFEYISPSIKNVLGYSQEEFMTHFSKYLTDNPINKEVNQKTELSIKGIQQLPYELEIYDSHKNIHILEVSETPLTDIEGNVIAVEGIAHDITKHKKAEETINQQLEEITVQNEEIRSTNEEIHAVNDDLERRIEEINRLNENLKISENELRASNAQKDKFFSLLAHDLRSPIGNFLQISELLKLNYEELSKDQINSFFDNLYTLADNTFKLLDNLLMWSRSQLGRLEIKNENINLFKIVEDVVVLFEENLVSKRVRLFNEIPEELNINTDLNVIQTVFRNLISNAIKFSYSGGSVTVNAKIEKNDINNNAYIIVSVKDTGVGIPKNKIDKIFDIDVDYTTLGTKSEKGTGLGLILCKELIEKNGDKIWVGSEESNLPAARLLDGQGRQGGSTFYFTLRR